MSRTVLITGIGGDVSQGVATILRESRPDLRLIGVDASIQHGGHRLVDHFEIVPVASNEGYPAAIREISSKYKVDLFIPMSEPELAVLQKCLPFADRVEVIFPGSQAIEAGLDKLATAQVLARLGIPGPWTTVVGDDAPPALPCILKKRTGSGSRDVFIVTNEEEIAYLTKRIPDAIFQELLLPADREVTCAVYRSRDGRIATLQLLRRLTGGFTGWAKVIRHAGISEICERLAVGLDLRGSMNVQLRITEDGPRIFEINPRFSSTVLMRHRLGYTDVLWALAEAEGSAVEFPNVVVDQIVVRGQDAVIVSEIKIGDRK